MKLVKNDLAKAKHIFAKRLQNCIDIKSDEVRSQSRQATEIGISSSSLSNYISEANECTSGILYLISTYFGISIDYLLGKSEENSFDVEKQRRFYITHLTETALKQLNNIVVYERAWHNSNNTLIGLLNSLLSQEALLELCCNMDELIVCHERYNKYKSLAAKGKIPNGEDETENSIDLQDRINIAKRQLMSTFEQMIDRLVRDNTRQPRGRKKRDNKQKKELQ